MAALVATDERPDERDSGEHFTQMLPLMRRTFATFPAPERRWMGERTRQGRESPVARAQDAEEFDTARAEAVLPLVASLLGLDGDGRWTLQTNACAAGG